MTSQISKMKCDYACCDRKCCYGNFCKNHRSSYLLDSDGMILMDRFTGKSQDYYRPDLRKYCITILKGDPKIIYSLKKEPLFGWMCHKIKEMRQYEKHTLKIIKIQALIRGYNIRTNLKKRKECNNNEDFFTFENISDISDLYFFSYKDIQGFRWGFDIRSLDRLIQEEPLNPYTRQEIPETIIEKIRERIEIIKLQAPYEDIMDIVIRDRLQAIKQKSVDLFSKIEQSGYTCHVEWFLNLSLRRLREFYRQFEDVWNYRAQLTPQMKALIAPPDGRLFLTPVSQVRHFTQKEDIQELLLDELKKFTRAESEANQKLGYMYFLIAFGCVSPPCYLAHSDWLNMIN